MAQIITACLLVGGGLIALFAILLAMPQSQLRSFLLPIVGWTLVACCAAYTVSPIDAIPEGLLGPLGWVDDVMVILGAIYAAKAALEAGKDEPDADV